MPKRIRSLACKIKKAHERSHHEHAGHPAFRAQWLLTEFCVAPPANAPGFRRLPGFTLTANTTVCFEATTIARADPGAHLVWGRPHRDKRMPLAVRFRRCRHPACFYTPAFERHLTATASHPASVTIANAPCVRRDIGENKCSGESGDSKDCHEMFRTPHIFSV